MVNNEDQMLKGARFIWYYWSQCISAGLTAQTDTFVFAGAISAFKNAGKGIVHKRTVVKSRQRPEWTITDEVTGAPNGTTKTQIWHQYPANVRKLIFTAVDDQGNDITLQKTDGWYSGLYGHKEKSEECYFCTTGNVITTVIKVDNP